MKKALQVIEDILLFIPAVLAVLVMLVCGLFYKGEEFDPYI